MNNVTRACLLAALAMVAAETARAQAVLNYAVPDRSVGETGATLGDFTITCSPPGDCNAAVTIDWAIDHQPVNRRIAHHPRITPGTQDADFAVTSGSLNWPAQKTFAVTIVDDDLPEGAESFSIRLSVPADRAASYVVGAITDIVSIYDDDHERGWLFDPFIDKTGAGRLFMFVFEAYPKRGDTMLGIDCDYLFIETLHWRRQSVPVQLGGWEESYRVEKPEDNILEFREDTEEIVERMAAAAGQGTEYVRIDGRPYSLKNFVETSEQHGEACRNPPRGRWLP